jgi:hypothetical protein
MHLIPIALAVALVCFIASRLRRYCRHCKGLGKVHRFGKPRDCRWCKGTGKAPRKRRKDERATRDPIHGFGDPIAAYRRKSTAPKEHAR